MSGPKPFDPRINCAAEICCPEIANANAALASLLGDLGVPDESLAEVVRRMRESGLVFLPSELAVTIRQIALDR